jgi:prepilin-type N-terminal cleavage/methylation domain-containing protein
MIQSQTRTRYRRASARSRSQAGFSLLETLVVVTLLLIVLGIATDGLIQMQKKSGADTGKVDTTQMGRQFMDQIVNDLHQAGYPGIKVYDPAAAIPVNGVAAGLLNVDANAVDFEGDVDASGTVSHVWLRLLWSDGTPVSGGAGACPCTLQRGTLDKAQVGTLAVPYYTEINNVTNTNIFSAYLFDGTQVALPASPADLLNIKTVKITVNLQSPAREMDGTYPTITLASEAKINN